MAQDHTYISKIYRIIREFYNTHTAALADDDAMDIDHAIPIPSSEHASSLPAS